MESPPSRKYSSSAPAAVSRASSQRAASASSVGVRGATCSGRARSSAGAGARQSGPVGLAVLGEREAVQHRVRRRHREAEAGRGQAARARSSAAAGGSAPGAVSRWATRRGCPGSSSRTVTTASSTPGWRTRTASTSPASMRWPRGFQLVVGAAQVVSSPPLSRRTGVAGAVHAGTGRAVRVGAEPGRSQPGPAEVAAGPAPARRATVRRRRRRGPGAAGRRGRRRR